MCRSNFISNCNQSANLLHMSMSLCYLHIKASRNDIVKCIFLKEKSFFSNWTWKLFFTKASIDNKWALVQVMAWYWTGNKPVYDDYQIVRSNMFPHSVSTRQDSCVRGYAPLTLAPPSWKKNEQVVTQLSIWTKRGGIWTDAWVCLHYWVVIWVAG